MHVINMAEITEDFARCWKAAGLHIEKQLQDKFHGWLRCNLTPPFLEHLSFRLGNQLFFIHLVDVDGLLETPSSLNGLLAIADGCKGHACLMPMRKRGNDWQPSEIGWGLIEARTYAYINPVELVSDEKIKMTEWELHDFAVQVVRQDLVQQGREMMSWQGNPEVKPSIWFVGDNGPEWVVVKCLSHPSVHEGIIETLSTLELPSAKGNFAIVTVANANDPFDLDAINNGNFELLYRGEGMMVKYEGLITHTISG